MYSEVTFEYRGRLPHLVKAGKSYFVTFCTSGREVLPPGARTLVLRSSAYDHGSLCWTDCVIVMPDHVHLIVTPYEHASLSMVMQRIKSASAYRVNRLLARKRLLWQRESFDRIVRSEENLDQKREYILNNPVRAGLVERWQDYPWIWTPWRGAAGS